jgi:hypothetical protein
MSNLLLTNKNSLNTASQVNSVTLNTAGKNIVHLDHVVFSATYLSNTAGSPLEFRFVLSVDGVSLHEENQIVQMTNIYFTHYGSIVIPLDTIEAPASTGIVMSWSTTNVFPAGSVIIHVSFLYGDILA